MEISRYMENNYLKTYCFPSLELLQDNDETPPQNIFTYEETIKAKIKSILDAFHIYVKNVSYICGGLVTLFEVELEDLGDISKIKQNRDEISLSLNNARILIPIPGTHKIGIEISNQNINILRAKMVLQSEEYKNSGYHLPIAIGKTIDNKIFCKDLSKLGHIIIGGAVGQGKSAVIDMILASILYSKKPEEVKFVLLDPRKINLNIYSKISKQYLTSIPGGEPVICEFDKIYETLQSLNLEIEKRYKYLKETRTRSIVEYNQIINNKESFSNFKSLPYIVVVIDEISDLFMNIGKKALLLIDRLAQQGRVVGVHVIMGTQHPHAKILNSFIKANFPTRIALRLSSELDSKLVIDNNDATKLVGKGDMLVAYCGAIERVQCAYISAEEINNVCNHVALQPDNVGKYELTKPNENHQMFSALGGLRHN